MLSRTSRASPTSSQLAMDELTDVLADAVRLRVVGGLSYGDIAARLGCGEAAARQRVARGLSTLTDRLEAIPMSTALEADR